MSKVKKIKTALVTGSAGFIGYHVSQRAIIQRLESCWHRLYVGLLRCFLKRHREGMLFQSDKYISIHSKIEDPGAIHEIFEQQRPDLVVHLAAQAGVRYSIVNPRTYLESNIIGTFEILEAARSYPPKHMLFASTSSAYGANKKCHTVKLTLQTIRCLFTLQQRNLLRVWLIATHIYLIYLLRMFRFYSLWTVGQTRYGSLFKFTKAILCDQPIDVYNNGNMRRDFTFISDLISAIELLVAAIPTNRASEITKYSKIDSKSSIAPFRVINIGNSCSVPLMEFIETIEDALSKKATKNFLPIQAGDVPETLADTSLLSEITDINHQQM